MYPNERSEWGHISPCLLRFEFCKKPVGRTLNFLLSISAHFVKAIKGKMLVTDCKKARMQSRADEVRLSRPLTEWSDPHYSRKGARKACSLCHTASARGANCGQACYAWRGCGVASPMLFTSVGSSNSILLLASRKSLSAPQGQGFALPTHKGLVP